MLDFLRQTFARLRPDPARRTFEDWAAERGHEIKPAQRGGAVQVHGKLGRTPWRLEWSEPQRPYIRGRELRLKADTDAPRELTVLLLNRTLRERTERAMYDSYINDLQTRSDTDTPPEMRWLLLHPALDESLPGAARAHWAAVGTDAEWARRWSHGALAEALQRSSRHAGADHPVVLTLQRSRLQMRTALVHPDEDAIVRQVTLFEAALRAALRLGEAAQAEAARQAAEPAYAEPPAPTTITANLATLADLTGAAMAPTAPAAFRRQPEGAH